MKSYNMESTSGADERKLEDYIQQANDFYKIELLRQAKQWYEKALNINPENQNIQYLISECKRKLAYENKVVYILITIASTILLIYYLFLH